ncbi:MAG: Cof-type HAD-IIB family hydrolase [Defluviitaleaceae bacterium]|nr:Cof-type HAD-IIB family hydrolase [Defluviitaleaceae bacterium]
MRYKLIATDVDGTLGNSKYIVDEANRAAARKAEESGIEVVLCSGRSVSSLKYIVEQELQLKGAYLIGFNGGAIVHSGNMNKPILESKLKKEYAIEGHNFLKQYELDSQGNSQIVMGLYTSFDDILTEQKELLKKLYIKQNNKMNIIEQKNITDLEGDIFKLLILGENKILKELEPKLIELAKDRYDVVFTGHYLLELVPKGVNKGTALVHLADYLKIDIEKTIGFGDNYNDLELIKQAGLGVAIANAVPELKAIANKITKNDNDNSAFAEVVEYALS